MSSAFAIGAVTLVLRDLLNNGVNDNSFLQTGVGNVTVSALPPDRIPISEGDERSRINLFMYQATPNQGWQNVGLASRNNTGERISNPPLALDLHYLVSVYGQQEFHAEALLGYAMQLLHENPVLTRAAIRATLQPVLPGGISPPAELQMLALSDLADQVEQLKIIPQRLSSEEMSKLWMTFQARYRPSAAYQISVVLIESNKPAVAPLPVLKRGKDDTGADTLLGPFPSLNNLHIGVLKDADKRPRPASFPSGQPDLLLTISGEALSGDQLSLRFVQVKLEKEKIIPIPVQDRKTDEIKLILPDDLGTAGFYLVEAIVKNGTEERRSNQLSLAWPAQIDSITPKSAARDLKGKVTLTLTTKPQILPAQRASLLLAGREIIAQPHAAATNSLTFVIENAPVVTNEFLRLRLDGVDSLPFKYDAQGQLIFDDAQKVTIT